MVQAAHNTVEAMTRFRMYSSMDGAFRVRPSIKTYTAEPRSSPRTNMRRAKIVCTLGPASKEPAFIGHLIDEGMNVARINFSHGDYDDHARVITAVRRESEKRGRPV